MMCVAMCSTRFQIESIACIEEDVKSKSIEPSAREEVAGHCKIAYNTACMSSFLLQMILLDQSASAPSSLGSPMLTEAKSPFYLHFPTSSLPSHSLLSTTLSSIISVVGRHWLHCFVLVISAQALAPITRFGDLPNLKNTGITVRRSCKLKAPVLISGLVL